VWLLIYESFQAESRAKQSAVCLGDTSEGRTGQLLRARMIRGGGGGIDNSQEISSYVQTNSYRRTNLSLIAYIACLLAHSILQCNAKKSHSLRV
jgi:hypothetical protein